MRLEEDSNMASNSKNNSITLQKEEEGNENINKKENSYQSQQQQQQPPSDGVWVGIDLGTTNCVCAIWDCTKSKSKLLRLGGYYNLASPLVHSTKQGRIVPSALLFLNEEDMEKEVQIPREQRGVTIKNRFNERKANVVVGHAAMKMLQHSIDTEKDSDEISGAMVTSMKRILGMTCKQVHNLEDQNNDEFLRSLPFQAILVDDDGNIEDGAEKNKSNKENEKDEEAEGIMVQVKPLKRNENPTSNKNENNNDNCDDDILAIAPIQLVSILLQSIRLASQQFLISSKGSILNPPGKTPNKQLKIKNCVIGVPAHFGRTQRNAVIKASKMAGFDGVVETITESTAAAMAYGLHVSPPVTASTTASTTDDGHVDNSVINKEYEEKERVVAAVRSILVFDMGGGTTDVTIANMSFPSSSSSEEKEEEERFKVIATAGDCNLGGDNMDEALVNFVLQNLSENNKLSSSSSLTVGEKRRLYQECRNAKERLCGGGSDNQDPPPEASTAVKFGSKNGAVVNVNVTQEDFEKIIAPLVLRAHHVVEEALLSYSCNYSTNKVKEEEKKTISNIKIDEVVLVGGATRVPAIRKMLRTKFPPPNPPDLCCSVNAEAAVAQGCAIRAAFLSKLVPRYELRSALMLDALPHSIGVLVKHTNAQNEDENDDNDNDGHFVPILQKDTPLPAMNYATFTLADIHQKGVSVIAVEDVGEEFPLQRIGTFHFLLHKLTENEMKHLEEKEKGGQEKRGRTVDIGMTVETSGRFIVSIFDSNDPEHILKKKRYQEQKRARNTQQQKEKKEKKNTICYTGNDDDDEQQNDESDEASLVQGKEESMTIEQVQLTIVCVIMFLLYVGARITFSEPPTEESARII